MKMKGNVNKSILTAVTSLFILFIFSNSLAPADISGGASSRGARDCSKHSRRFALGYSGHRAFSPQGGAFQRISGARSSACGHLARLHAQGGHGDFPPALCGTHDGGAGRNHPALCGGAFGTSKRRFARFFRCARRFGVVFRGRRAVPVYQRRTERFLSKCVKSLWRSITSDRTAIFYPGL